MKKNKGMKIYKQKKRNNNQLLSVLLTSALLFGVGVFGYYVVAVPFSNFVETYKNRKTDDDDLDEIIVAEKNDPEETVPLKTEPLHSDNEPFETSETKEAPVTTVPAVSEKPDSTSSVTTVVSSTSVSVQKPAETEPAAPVYDEGGCIRLSSDDISSADSLRNKLSSIGSYKSVVLPLKTAGGRICYNSSVDTAHYSGAVVSDTDIKSIVKVCAEKGIAPVAEISTIADNIYPVTYKKSAYQFDDGVTGEWLDNKPEKGGKPWLSPFADQAKSYLSEIVSELSEAGIKKIICTDTAFPAFREKDLGYIGELVQSENRYKGLTDLINLLDKKAGENNGKVMLYVTASEVLNSSAEVFRPEEFGTMPAVIGINSDDLSGQSAADVMKNVSGKSGSMKLVPCIISDGMSESEIESSVNSLEKAGYDYYIVR